MTLQIALSPEAEARLTAEALANEITPDEHAARLLQELLSAPAEASGKISPEELQTMLRSIAEGSEKLARLPTSAFTRESFYEERL